MLQRIQKFLSHQGLASRRTIESWINLKRLKVNGEFAYLGLKVSGTEQFILDDQILSIQFSARDKFASHFSTEITLDQLQFNNSKNQEQNTKLLLYHKPIGRICSTKEPFNDCPTVFEDLPKISYGKWISIGRLDINTSGLLLFTNDGDLAHKFMHPNFNQEREYLVRVYGSKMTTEQLSLFTKGILLEDGIAKFKNISLLNKSRMNNNDMQDAISKSGSSNSWYKVVLTEGRNREVRRLFAAQGLVVNRLVRIRFGNIVLPKYLKPGEYKFINL